MKKIFLILLIVLLPSVAAAVGTVVVIHPKHKGREIEGVA